CVVDDGWCDRGNSSRCRANITVALCRPVKKSYLGSVRRRLCSHGAHTGCPLKAIEQAQIRCALFLFHKSHAAVRIEIDPYQISEPYLSGRYQVCEREHNVFLNGAFQMPGSVFRIRTVFQKKVFHALHAMKSELPDPGRRQDAL